ncbi:MAG: DUF530 family protein [Methanomicrobia archaeon]|nr:DUF530 family protein [Methanomicrobia archaeon]
MSLTYRVNKFLDSLKYDFEIDKLDDKEYFKEIYFKISKNLSIMENFKEEMEFYGFPNPFYPLKGLKGSEPFFRNRAQLKKLTYERNSYALSAHRIALEHLKESIMLKNDKKYTGREALKYINKDLKFCRNEEGVYRLEILRFLPLSGDYMVKLSQFTKEERKNYRKILSIIDKEKGGVSSVSFYVRYKTGMKKKNIPLKEYKEFIEDKMSIKSSKVHRKKGGLIKDRHIRKILAISYAPIGIETFVFDLAMFYLKKGKYERERYSGIFPTLSSEIPHEKLGKYGEIIELKERMEEELQKLGRFEKSLTIGGIAYYKVTGNMEETLRYFNMSEKKLKRKLEEFETIGLLSTKSLKPRTQKFLKYLKR